MKPRVFRTRIGKIKLHNGAELRIMPPLKQRIAEATVDALAQDAEEIITHYNDDLAGFVLIAFNSDLDYTVRMRAYKSIKFLDLPNWVSEAMRTHLSEQDTRRLLDMDHG